MDVDFEIIPAARIADRRCGYAVPEPDGGWRWGPWDWVERFEGTRGLWFTGLILWIFVWVGGDVM